MPKLNVTAVSYLNTKPLLYGIFQNRFNEKINLQLDIPSVCADKLKDGSADLGLVPVAVIPHLDNPHIISDYCIGAEGAVKTVCIFSEVPIQEMTHIYLDYHSRTSVELAKILMKEYWKVNPIILPAIEGFEQKIQNTKGALIIGDRTIGLENKYAYSYDLAEVWLEHTGLPFVFAAWVSNKPLEKEFVKEFNAALEMGVNAIPELLFILQKPKEGFDLEAYFSKYISYQLDAGKREALDLFLEKLKQVDRNAIPVSIN